MASWLLGARHPGVSKVLLGAAAGVSLLGVLCAPYQQHVECMVTTIHSVRCRVKRCVNTCDLTIHLVQEENLTCQGQDQ